MAKNTRVSNPINNFSKHSQESYLSYPYVVTTKVKPKTKQQQRKYNGTQKILIVDDEPDVILSFTSCLSSEGYYVETFTESREALRHFLELDNPGYYQLAIIDIRMPAINGVQLYQILRTLNPGIKVLFVSARDAAVELTSIFPEVMSKDIIRKPITEDAFVKKVSATLSIA